MTTPAARAASWNRLIAEWRKSGLTQIEFCRRRGLGLHTFRSWLYRKPADRPGPDRSTTPAAAPRFVPVRIVAAAAPAPRPAHRPIEVLLDGGRRIAVAPGFDAETLRRAVAALEGPAC